MTSAADSMQQHQDHMDRYERHRAFELAWSSVEPVLRRWLAARRVPLSDRDDYIQEVATRVIAGNAPLHCSTELLRWSTTVLRHLHIDRGRTASRARIDLDLSEDAADVAASVDLAAQVVARLDLAVIADAISSWSEAQRRTLLEDGIAGTTRSSASALYVARHRLRARLLAAIDGLGALWLGLWRRVDPNDGDRATATVLVPSAALACAVTITVASFAGNGPNASMQPPPRDARLAAPHRDPHANADVGINLEGLSVISHKASTGTTTTPGAPAPEPTPVTTTRSPAVSPEQQPLTPNDQLANPDDADVPVVEVGEGNEPETYAPVSCITDSSSSGDCVDVQPDVDKTPGPSGESKFDGYDDIVNDVRLNTPDYGDRRIDDRVEPLSPTIDGATDPAAPTPPCDDAPDPTNVLQSGSTCPAEQGAP